MRDNTTSIITSRFSIIAMALRLANDIVRGMGSRGMVSGMLSIAGVVALSCEQRWFRIESQVRLSGGV